MSPLEKARRLRQNRQALKARRVAPSIKQIVAFLDSNNFNLANPSESDLVQRALWLAQQNSATLHLVYVVPGFATRFEQEEANEEATRLAESATQMDAGLARVRTNVVCARDPVSAQISCAQSLNADLIMKEYEERAFIVGLRPHDDWALLRRTPIPVWFVKSSLGVDREKDTTVLASVGSVEQQGDLTANDLSVVAYAHKFSKDATAGLRCVYHHHMDSEPPSVTAFAPFRLHLGITNKQFSTERGRSQKRLPQLAEQTDASLLVLGSRHKSYFGRLFEDVECEPVLAASAIDVLFVPDVQTLPEAATQALDGGHVGSVIVGEKDADFSRALKNPGACFNSPAEVVELAFTSDLMKRKILDAWMEDITLLELDRGEGGQSDAPDANLHASLNKAMRDVDSVNQDMAA